MHQVDDLPAGILRTEADRLRRLALALRLNPGLAHEAAANSLERAGRALDADARDVQAIVEPDFVSPPPYVPHRARRPR